MTDCSDQAQDMAKQAHLPASAYLETDTFIHLSLSFPYVVLPKSPKSLPFPTFGATFKHSIINSVQSYNAFPLLFP